MYAYHIDRSSKLIPNQTVDLIKNIKLENILNLYNNALSKHGFYYLNDCSNSSIWELCLEFIRLSYFPHFPSRLQSVFGTKSLEQAILWRDFFSVPSNICKIKCEKAYEFDANFITNPHNIKNTSPYFNDLSIAKMLEISYKYWNQEKTDNPFFELVIPLPIKVVKIL